MNFFEFVLVLILPRSFATFLEKSGVEIIGKYDNVLIVYQTDMAHTDNFKFVMHYLLERNRPLLIINEHSKTTHIHKVFSPSFLTVVFLSLRDNLKKLLADNMKHIRQTPVIIFMPKGYPKEELFKYLWKQRIIYVAAIEETSEVIWTYTHFPDFRIEIKEFLTFETIHHFNGSALRVMWGDIEPRTIRYVNREGHVVIGGYAGAAIPLFAEVYQLKLIDAVPVGLKQVVYSDEMDAYIKNDTIDLGTAVKYGMDITNQSYPLETVKWCAILPIDYDMEIYKYYGMIFRTRMWLLVLFTCIVNALILFLIFKKYHGKKPYWTVFATVYRSMLGEAFDVKVTFSSARFYYANMNLQGVLVTVFYTSLLSSMFVRMPIKNQINTYEELYESELKVWVFQAEWDKFMKPTIPHQKYYESFEIMDDYQKMVFERENFNTSQGYTMASDKWRTVDIWQSMMTRPIFRFTDICFLDIAMLSYPIDENSIYKDVLNKFIFDVKEHGFIDYFHSKNLDENFESGRINIQDDSIDHLARIIRLEDIEVFFFGLFGFLFIAFVTFLVELKNKK